LFTLNPCTFRANSPYAGIAPKLKY
jgi:hypothetical protein